MTSKYAAASTTDASDLSGTKDDPVRFDSSGNVQVYIHLENTNADTLQDLRGLGATIEITNSDVNIVQAWVPISVLNQISELDAVQEITPPDYGETKAGSVNTEGDGIHRADLVRAFSGLNGTGVKVGVISDGVDSWTSSRSRGDLPSSIEINPDNDGSGDEGTALLEIIHDLAPGAQLAFSAAGSSLGFVEATLWLANDAFNGEGADIIVDDLGYYSESFFEDGLVALAVDDAVAGGAVFVSAAGNSANKHYDGQFSEGGSGYHNFGPSGSTDISLRIGVGRGVVLQWNDQFGSSGNDYDLFVCPPGLKPVKFNLQNNVCAGSTRAQNGDDNPLEVVSTLFTDYPVADVYIRKYSGAARQLKLFVLGGGVLEHGVEEGGIIGHPAVSGVLAVGAIAAADPGNDEPEAFSDRGPTEIYFPSEETRNKPDVMGIDGVTVTGVGGFGIPLAGINGSRFYGTSAAAPHVAGIAALVMEAQRLATPGATKKTVADAVTRKLKDTAIDLGNQDSSGYNETFGYGRADALAAIESIAASSDDFDLDSLDLFPDEYTVDSTDDGADSSTSDGVCDDGTLPGSTNCTLRAAIQQTNAGNGAVIKFNISGSGTQTIIPASTLPTITKPVFIDGYSQSGASAGTLLIELDGDSAGTGTNGLTLSGKGSYIRGLAVNSFKGNGIVVQGSGGGQVLVGNYIGTDDTDSTNKGNEAAGVYINGAPNVVLRDNVISGNTTHGVHINGSGAKRAVIFGITIGLNDDGTADLGNAMAGVYVNGAEEATLRENVISGNDTHGVSLSGSGAHNADIQYNLIGVNASGTSDHGNTGSGIHISGARNTGIYENVVGGNASHGISLTSFGTMGTFIGENYIGTNESGGTLGNGGSGVHIANSSYNNFVEVNTIANNTGDGVTITATGTSLGNTIWENSIHGNGGLGIDLKDDGVTANDTGDFDTGPNFLQNYPANITFATRGDVASVRFTQEVTANRLYIVDYYSCDTSASGEGKEWLGFSPVQGDITGNLTFSPSIFENTIGDFTAPDSTATHITATATDTITNSTSEFAPCVARVDLPELVISENSIEVTEADTATYTVRLSALPSANVTVTLTSGDTEVATVSDAALTFTTTNGTTAQTITVTGAGDADADNEATAILHEVSIGSYSYPTVLLPVEVTEDDAPALTLTSTHAAATFPSDVSVGHFLDGRIGNTDNPFNEGGTATYTVQLADEPDGDTTISLSSSDTGALTVSPTSITFTKAADEDLTANKFAWNNAQTITLTAESDTGAGDEIESVYHEITVDGKDYVLGLVRALIRDTGLPALTYTPDTREVTIGSEGGTATYTIVPATEPASNLAMRIFSSDVDSVTVSPLNHTFTVGTNANWETPLTVTVTGVADGDTFNDIAFIRHRTTFGGDDVSWASVQVTVSDGNRAPFFEDGLTTTREVPENASQGASVGDPVTATDLDGDTLTYSLEDPEGKFEITSSNSTTGQITVISDNSLDHEDVQDYSIEVAVTDRTTDGLTDKIEVKVLVTNVNDPPVIARTTGDDALSYPEDTATTRVLHRYTATDQERGTITWSVEGTDGSDFTIDASGNLRFASQPDHEAKPTLGITIVATDDGDPFEKDELPVTVTLTDVNEPPEIFLGEATKDYDENGIIPVEQYFARDPEQATTVFTWRLSGTDQADFTITANGQLQFASTPDFESPADSGRNNEYNVTVLATDDATPAKTGTFDVTVTVRDLNEEPTVTGDAVLSYPEDTATTRVLDRYTASDPERSPVSWSMDGTDADAFRIDSSGNLYFDGVPDHETPTDSGGNNVYEFQVVATDDGNLGDGMASQRGAMDEMFDVTVTVTNVDEPPVITGTTTIDDYDESGTGDVATYTADDPEDNTPITWSLGGSDRNDFTIDGDVLKFASAPDYENPADSGGNNHYDVTIYATDSTNKRGELHVDVIVQNVDEPPMIAGLDVVDDFPENSATSRQVGRYTATDPEGATVTLSLSSGGADFALASNGVLTFAQSPDYEEQSRYIVTVRAVAGSHTVNKTVTVNIQNVEEPGAVSLSTVQPQEGTSLTATLEDDDVPSGTTWQWYRTSSRRSTGTEITGATSDSYTPDADDVGSYLRAVATYDDVHGIGKTAATVSANRVQEAPPTPEPPVFPADGDYDRSLRENQTPPRNLGSPVTATDENNDRLTYSIPASDYFEIVDSTGQLRTKIELDHEGQATHFVTVTATDPGGLDVSQIVTITVEDLDETPEISGPNNPEVAENGNTSVATYTATDPDNKGIDWVLTGTDSDAFTLSGGFLSFKEVPDYEEKNSFRVTIEARERSPGTSVASLSVTVRVTNIDEDGMVVVPVSEPRVGLQLTPTVEDPDGGVGSIEWKWESSPNPQSTGGMSVAAW